MNRHVLIAIVFITILGSATTALSLDYSITDLGSVSVVDINNQGMIVGNSSNGAFIWGNGNINNIGSFVATDINNSGQVAGYENMEIMHRIISWDNGVTNMLAVNNFTPDGPPNSQIPVGWGAFINDSGSIYVNSNLTCAPYIGVLKSGSSLWEYVADTFDKNLYAVNNNNQVVGVQLAAEAGFINTNGSNVYLEKMYPTSINDSGYVTGITGYSEAFLWLNGNATLMGYGRPYDINNSGQIVGVSGDHATIWQNEIMLDLNELINNPDWFLTSAASINDAGQIIGTGLINGETHSFLLDPKAVPPVPEPSTFILLCAGLAVAAFLRKSSHS